MNRFGLPPRRAPDDGSGPPPEPRRFWGKVKRNLHRLPFAEDLGAVWYCARDPATPAAAKAVLFGALAYFVLPADAIPDLITGPLGFTDDAAVIGAAVAAISHHLRPRHREAARLALARLRGEAGDGEGKDGAPGEVGPITPPPGPPDAA